MVSFRVDEDDFIRLDALARQTSCSRAEHRAETNKRRIESGALPMFEAKKTKWGES